MNAGYLEQLEQLLRGAEQMGLDQKLIDSYRSALGLIRTRAAIAQADANRKARMAKDWENARQQAVRLLQRIIDHDLEDFLTPTFREEFDRWNDVLCDPASQDVDTVMELVSWLVRQQKHIEVAIAMAKLRERACQLNVENAFFTAFVDGGPEAAKRLIADTERRVALMKEADRLGIHVNGRLACEAIRMQIDTAKEQRRRKEQVAAYEAAINAQPRHKRSSLHALLEASKSACKPRDRRKAEYALRRALGM